MSSPPASAYGAELQPFAGITSFMRCPVTRDLTGVDVAVVGVPYDGGTSYRSGARFGPRKIREASLMLWGYNNPLAVKPLDVLKVIDYGDVDVIPPAIVDTYQNIESEVGGILRAGAAVISLGGDHSISLPLLRAHARQFGPLSVVHFDSHPDTWDTEFGGRPYSHGTPFRRALEEMLIHPAGYVQVGLREHACAAIGDQPVVSVFDADDLTAIFVVGGLHRGADHRVEAGGVAAAREDSDASHDCVLLSAMSERYSKARLAARMAVMSPWSYGGLTSTRSKPARSSPRRPRTS